jgi:hypothetical protein
VGKKSQIHIIGKYTADQFMSRDLTSEGTMAGPGQEAEGKGIRAGEEALLSAALEEVRELNERCLVLLQRLAGGNQERLPRFLGVFGPSLRRLDASRIAAVARQPFLLVDFAFGKPRVLRELLARGPTLLRFPTTRGSLPVEEATSLARGALGLAKTVCRHHPAHAGLLFGLDPSLQEQFAQLRVSELERLAEEHPHQLSLRWENRTDIWSQLLGLAESSDPDASASFQMYAMQLIAGELTQLGRGRQR